MIEVISRHCNTLFNLCPLPPSPGDEPEPDLGLLRSELKRLSGLNARWLAFPRHLEERFERDTSARRCLRLWFEGLLAILMFDLFLCAEHLFSPADFHRALLVRLGVITPIAVAVNVSMLFRPNKHVRELSIAAVGSIAGLTHLYLTHGMNIAITVNAQLGIVAVLVFLNALMRVRVPYAMGASAVLAAGDLYFLIADHTLLGHQKVISFCFVIGMLAATLISNYSFSREERINFLLCLQAEITVKELNHANAELQILARKDALTGLANRHSFNTSLALLWRRAFAAGQPLSLIVVDVDRFKAINDTYGHPYGDKVLMRIGLLLSEAMRRKEDLAARFGGEEFVILLPDTSLKFAIAVAERLCNLVRVAGLPPTDAPGQSFSGHSVTISCGVACAVPQSRTGFEELLQRADSAVYCAKREGRDRVCSAAESLQMTDEALADDQGKAAMSFPVHAGALKA